MIKQIAKAQQESPRALKLILKVRKFAEKVLHSLYSVGRRLNRFIFLLRLNRKLKEFDAKATLFKESVEGDILEIKICNEFCHVGIIYYTPYFLNYVITQVILKKSMNDCSKGIRSDYRK